MKLLKKINSCLGRSVGWLNRIVFRGYVDVLIDRCVQQQDAIYAKVYLLALQKMGKKKTVLNFIQSQKQKVTSHNIMSAMGWLDIGDFPTGLLDGFSLLEKKVDRKILYANILLAPLPVVLCMCFAFSIKGCPFGLHLLACLFAGYLIGSGSVLVSLKVETFLKKRIYLRWLGEQEAKIVTLRVVDI
jgi:hypothetical protein